MKTPKVSLYIRIRRSDGKYAFVEPVWNRNHTLRGLYAEVGGKTEYHPEGMYYLRYKRGERPRKWQAVGSDPNLATVALQNLEHDLRGIGLGRQPRQDVTSSDGRGLPEELLSVEEAIQRYLGEVRRFRSAKTIAACENMLSRLSARMGDTQLKALTRDDLMDHMFALKMSGLSDRTLHNHMSRIASFLKSFGITGILRPNDKPRYDEKEVSAYNGEELSRLFAFAEPDDRLLFEFFLGTGFREQETMFCTWANVDFKSKVISVRSKPEMGFRVKDKEERSVPVPDSLISALAARKLLSTSSLLFPSTRSNPDGHMLRRLQLIAYRAGLNCGECVTKGGARCSDRPVCSAWGLHKFRKTFATMHSEAGVSAPNIQRWLGHSDLSTTLRYLAVADLRSERTRSQVNATFARLAVQGAA